MFPISRLSLGDKFQPSRPSQVDSRGRKLKLSSTYQIMKIFTVPPFMRVCKELPNGGERTLGPKTLVILPGGVRPSKNDIKKSQRQKQREKLSPSGYEIMIPLGEPLPKMGDQAKRTYLLVAALGRRFVSRGDVLELMRINRDSVLRTSQSPNRVWDYYVNKHFEPIGLVRKIHDKIIDKS